MTEDRSRLLKLCFEEMEEVARLHDDLECCLNEVKRELNYILSELNVRDYHHDETLRYLGHEPDSKLNEGEIELTNHNITWIRNCCYDAISETEETLLPYFKTKNPTNVGLIIVMVNLQYLHHKEVHNPNQGDLKKNQYLLR